MPSMNDIPANLLDSLVSDQDIAKIASCLIKWEKLSPILGLTFQQETMIRETYRDYDIQKQQILHKWKQIKGNKATYNALITAASRVSDMELADNIKAMVQNDWNLISIREGVEFAEQVVFFCSFHLCNINLRMDISIDM